MESAPAANPMAGVRVYTAEDVGRFSQMQLLARTLARKGVAFEKWPEEIGLTPEEIVTAHYDLALQSRPIQNAPPGTWTRWLATGGRGAGKTFTATKAITEELERDPEARVLLVGPTRKGILATNLDGPSGLLTLGPPWLRLHHQPSKARIIAKATGATVEYIPAEAGPGRFKGRAFSFTVADEVVAWEVDPVGVYSEVCTITRHKTARMMREGIPSRVVVSSTPEPSDVFRRILEDRDSLVVTRMSSFENAAHLDASTVKFYRRMLSTALGRQEFLGELTFDLIAKGLFSSVDWLKATVELDKAPARYERIVIGYDPIQGGVSGKVDEAGIFVVGLRTAPDGLIHGYLLLDASLRSSQPKEVAARVVEVYRHWMGFADKCHVMVETNKGGQTSVDLLKMLEPKIRTEAVLAREAKAIRATPLAALLEAGLVHLVGSPVKMKAFIEQAKEFTGEDNKSDGRVDAAAWPVWQYVWKSMKNRGAIQKLEAVPDAT